MKVDQKHFEVLDKRTVELNKHFFTHERFFDKKAYYDRLDGLRVDLDNYGYELCYYIGSDDAKAIQSCKDYISDCEDMIQRAGVPSNAMALGWSTPDVHLDTLLHFIKCEFEKIIEELKK
mgnify:CR=1 FL=1